MQDLDWIIMAYRSSNKQVNDSLKEEHQSDSNDTFWRGRINFFKKVGKRVKIILSSGLKLWDTLAKKNIKTILKQY